MWVHLTPVSGNRKVGPIATSTTEEASCPPECPLVGTDCYARFGPLGMHWRKVKEGERGDNWTAFCNRLRKFSVGYLFRHNQAGDLPQTKRKTIHFPKLKQLVNAVRHMRGWTYTHYNPNKPENAKAIKYANDNGFTVNLSADTLAEADNYYNLGIGPVCVTIAQDAPDRGNVTPGGLPIVVCPAQTQETMNCATCKLCIVRNRKSIIGFRAHGTAKKRLTKRIESQ